MGNKPYGLAPLHASKCAAACRGVGTYPIDDRNRWDPAKFPTHKASPPCEVKNPLNNHASERVSGCSIGENPGWCKNRRGPTCFLHKHTYLQKLIWSGPIKLCTDVANAFPLEQAIRGNLWKIPTREISDSLYKWHQRNLEFSAGWDRLGPNRMLSTG